MQIVDGFLETAFSDTSGAFLVGKGKAATLRERIKRDKMFEVGMHWVVVKLWRGPASGVDDIGERTHTWVNANKELITRLGELMSRGPGTEQLRESADEEVTGGLEGKVRVPVKKMAWLAHE